MIVAADLVVVDRPSTIALIDTWFALNLDPRQMDYFESEATINWVPAGRRACKTELAKRRLVLAAMECQHTQGRFFACAPTQQQAEDIFWDDLKALVPKQFRRRKDSESEKKIFLINGAIIRVAGLDKPQRIEGKFWDGGVVDEYADCLPDAFDSHILPMLVRPGSYIDLIGVPEGRNHYYFGVQDAKRQLKAGLTDQRVFHWKASEVLWLYLGKERADQFLALTARRMDKRTFDQEWNAEFVSHQGKAYYCFVESVHAEYELKHDPHAPLIFQMDFNVSPGVCGIAQEQRLDVLYGGKIKLRDGYKLSPVFTAQIGEVHIPQHSNSRLICERLAHDWATKHKGPIHVYGDATGGNPGSAKLDGSDWEIVERHLHKHFGERVEYFVPNGNGTERSRVNSLNSRLCSADNTVAMLVDPIACPETVKDFEGSQILEGSAGALAKKGKANLKFTHLTDGIGYYTTVEFPVEGPGVADVQNM